MNRLVSLTVVLAATTAASAFAADRRAGGLKTVAGAYGGSWPSDR